MARGYPLKKKEKLNNLFVGDHKLYNIRTENMENDTIPQQINNSTEYTNRELVLMIESLEKRVYRTERFNDILLVGILGLLIGGTIGYMTSKKEYKHY